MTWKHFANNIQVMKRIWFELVFERIIRDNYSGYIGYFEH